MIGAIEHHTVSLEDEINFYDWSSQRWPNPRYKVELLPWGGHSDGWPVARQQH